VKVGRTVLPLLAVVVFVAFYHYVALAIVHCGVGMGQCLLDPLR